MVGRTRCCGECRLRFAGDGGCPRCGATNVSEASRTYLPRRRRWWMWPVVVTVVALSFVLGLAITGACLWGIFAADAWLARADGWPALLAFAPRIVLWVGIVASLIFGIGLPLAFGIMLAGELDLRAGGRSPIDAPEPTTTPADATVVTGTARSIDRWSAPVSQVECVAVELRTRGPTGAHRDAIARAFDVELDGGETVRVEPGPGTWLDLPSDGATELRLARSGRDTTDRPELRAICDDHALGLALGALDVEERLLRAGDAVEIRGGAERVAAGDGYRGARRVIASSPTSPMTIRSTRS